MTTIIAATSVLQGCAVNRAATLDALEAALSSKPSATAVLTDWCAQRGLAQAPAIVARRIAGSAALTEPEALRSSLAVPANETLGYRHVELVCGTQVLSVAHNWYVPARLSPEMNATLEGSDTPFGKIVGPLGFSRELLSSLRGEGPGCPPGTILTQRAVLCLPGGLPLSYLIECYTSANLAAAS